MEIYHIPLIPATDMANGYRLSREHYEADADSLHDYIDALLLDLNDGSDGTWRIVSPHEIRIDGFEIGHCVLRGDYPGEPPIMVAFYAVE